MSISSIFASAVDSTSSVSSLFAPSSTTSTTTSTDPTSTSATSTSVSTTGQLFAQLQQLATTDPDKFKQVTADISTQLQQAAQQGGSSSTVLTNLADKFKTASQTGDASALAPSHHHGGHHHGGGGGSTSTSSATQAAASAYASQSDNPISQLDTIIQNALNGSTTTASPASTALATLAS